MTVGFRPLCISPIPLISQPLTWAKTMPWFCPEVMSFQDRGMLCKVLNVSAGRTMAADRWVCRRSGRS